MGSMQGVTPITVYLLHPSQASFCIHDVIPALFALRPITRIPHQRFSDSPDGVPPVGDFADRDSVVDTRKSQQLRRAEIRFAGQRWSRRGTNQLWIASDRLSFRVNHCDPAIVCRDLAVGSSLRWMLHLAAKRRHGLHRPSWRTSRWLVAPDW